MLTEFFPRSADVEITGGVENRCYHVARHLSTRHDVQVLAIPTDGSTWEYASIGSLPARIRFVLRSLATGLRSDFDIVEGTNHVVHPVAWLIGRLRRRPVVQWYADVLLGHWSSDFGAAGWLGEVVERVSLSLPATHYLPISQTVARKLIARGIRPDKITVIPCGVDADEAASIRRQGVDKQVSIAVVSRLVRYKGVHLVVDAVASLAARGYDISACVVGQGPEAEALYHQAEMRGVGHRFKFLGHVPNHRDVLRIIASARLLVAPSSIEGFGIVVAEAMALGVPFVASDIEAFTEVTDGGRGGALFRCGDAQDLATQIAFLLDDQIAYAAASEEGLARSSLYQWNEIADRTEAVYQRLLPPNLQHKRSSVATTAAAMSLVALVSLRFAWHRR